MFNDELREAKGKTGSCFDLESIPPPPPKPTEHHKGASVVANSGYLSEILLDDGSRCTVQPYVSKRRKLQSNQEKHALIPIQNEDIINHGKHEVDKDVNREEGVGSDADESDMHVHKSDIDPLTGRRHFTLEQAKAKARLNKRWKTEWYTVKGPGQQRKTIRGPTFLRSRRSRGLTDEQVEKSEKIHKKRLLTRQIAATVRGMGGVYDPKKNV